MQKIQIVNSDKPVAFYNLDAMIAVGYYVNSNKAIEFMGQATQIIKTFIKPQEVIKANCIELQMGLQKSKYYKIFIN